MAPIRLCLVLEATSGGTRRHLGLLLHNLDRDKFELSCIVSPNREEGFLEDARRYREAGIRVEVVSMQRAISPVADLASYGAVKRAMADISPDIVHSHGSKGGFFGRLAARACGVKAVVHTPHVFSFQWNRGLKGRLYLALERYAARRCDRIVALSEGQRQLTASSGIKPAGAVDVIANGVDPGLYPRGRSREDIRAELSLPAEADIAVMVARLMPQKGCRNFIRAAQIALAESPDAHFCLIGGGPLEATLRDEVDRLGMSERFHMVGHREDAAELYPGFDLFVLSSLWEGMPYVLLEAMASSLAVVATRIPGTEDLVAGGETGLLADINDPAEIASAIVSLLSDPERRRSMGEAGRARVESRFTLARFIEAHEELYVSMKEGAR